MRLTRRHAIQTGALALLAPLFPRTCPGRRGVSYPARSRRTERRARNEGRHSMRHGTIRPACARPFPAGQLQPGDRTAEVDEPSPGPRSLRLHRGRPAVCRRKIVWVRHPGHNLCWNTSNPAWFDTVLNRQNARDYLAGHIATVAGRYRGKVEFLGRSQRTDRHVEQAPRRSADRPLARLHRPRVS